MLNQGKIIGHATFSIKQAYRVSYLKVMNWLEQLPEPEADRQSCERTIICECNRRNCIGRTVSTSYYVRSIKGA